jgi:hypothetical protein
MMLWQRRPAHQQESLNEPIYLSRQTTSTIKEFASRIDEQVISRAVHNWRVKKFSGLPDYAIPPVMLRDLYNKGFVWIVDASFVKKFCYHAAVGPDLQWHDHRIYIKQGRFRQAVIYAGDIPDFALERIDQVNKIGISNFTIHSMQPLPVNFVLTDPVLIGWPAMPSIEITNYGKGNQKLNFHVEDITGIVIAAWDTDRELEI